MKPLVDGRGDGGARGGSCWERLRGKRQGAKWAKGEGAEWAKWAKILNYILIKKTVLVVGEDLLYFSF